MAPASSALGPFDLAAAAPVTDDSLYVGKLVRDPTGAWVLLAFHNKDTDGRFGGTLTNPVPVRWDGNTLTIDPPGNEAISPRPGLPLGAGIGGSG